MNKLAPIGGVLIAVALSACGESAPTGSPASSAHPSAKPSASTKPGASSAAPPASATAPAAPSAAPSASAAEVEPPPFDGTLTIAQVMWAGKLVHPFDAWDDALKTIAAFAGKPTETHGVYSCWAAKEAEDCAYFCIEKTTFEKLKRDKKGPAVGSTDNPQRFGPTGPSGNVEACQRYAGKSAKK